MTETCLFNEMVGIALLILWSRCQVHQQTVLSINEIPHTYDFLIWFCIKQQGEPTHINMLWGKVFNTVWDTLFSCNQKWISWGNPITTGDCKDTCHMICIPDS